MGTLFICAIHEYCDHCSEHVHDKAKGNLFVHIQDMQQSSYVFLTFDVLVR